MKQTLITIAALAISIMAGAAPIKVHTNPATGAISQINIEGDTTYMDWLVKTDGSQYSWIGDKYGWGLGYFTLEGQKHEWKRPEKVSKEGLAATYRVGDISINVNRQTKGDDLVETYTFTNKGESSANLTDVGIYTPFNDNYPGAQDCIHRRANVHIWEGDDAAYVNALRMGAYAPHLGLMVTKGQIKSYDIWERGINKANSQTRGIIALNLPDLTLQPKQSYTLQWRVFEHQGNDDFKAQLMKRGGVIALSDKYVYEVGDTIKVELLSNSPIKASAMLNGKQMTIDRGVAYAVAEQPGEAKVEYVYGDGEKTHADCLVLSGENALIDRRVDFLLTNQQMNDEADLRYGAFIVYDNDLNRLYLNDTPNCNPVDRDEGAERVGMGILLAKYCRLHPSDKLKSALTKYADFVRNKLQTEDYVTYSSVDHKQRNRGYNYMWVADLYFHMYHLTGDKRYAEDGYNTLKSMYRQFGHGFYAIDIPVTNGLKALADAGMEAERADLLTDFEEAAKVMIKNGLNYPPFEVNYEQSIVAPAVQFLAEMYLATGKPEYLAEVERQLPVVEAFNGFQPSYHLNDIAIRHWDGYWFGKSEMFGDTFPHYWSAISAAAFHYYAKCTGKEEYAERARNIVRNNLCLFTEDGRGSCAYLYPNHVDGNVGKFYDAFANDQDWALSFYLLVNHEI